MTQGGFPRRFFARSPVTDPAAVTQHSEIGPPHDVGQVFASQAFDDPEGSDLGIHLPRIADKEGRLNG